MAVKKQTKPEITDKNTKRLKRDYIYAVGRTKQAIARVRLYPLVRGEQTWGDKKITKEYMLVNEMPVEHYFPGALAKAHYESPLKYTNTLHRYAFTIKVQGGGKNGQLDAVTAGIAKVLAAFDREKFRPTLKSRGLLTRDARVRERRKIGTGGKARRQKQSPKR